MTLSSLLIAVPAWSAPNPSKGNGQRQFEMGVELKNRRQFRPAIEFFSQAIAENPKFALAYRNRASCLMEIDNFDAAMIDVNKALALNPKLAIAYSDRGKIYNERRNSKQAIQDFSTAIALSKSNPNYCFYQDRGSLFKEAGNDNAALADFTEGLKIEPHDCWLHYFRGCIYYKRGNYKDALADATDALKTQSSDEKGSFYQLRAKCYDKLGKPNLAKKDRETATAAVGTFWGEK